MNDSIERLLSLLQIYLKLVIEFLTESLQRLLHAPHQKDGITINININHRRRSSLSSGKRTSRGVKFGELEIRTYESILGDNPSCSRGPPLSIGWKYDASRVLTFPIDVFENRPSRKHRPQVSEFELLMDRPEREQTLLDLGYTKSEIAAATRQGLRDKKKRRQTTDNLNASYVEEKMEGIKKSIRRRFLLKKGTKTLYKDWKKEVGGGEMEPGSWHRRNSIMVGRDNHSHSDGDGSTTRSESMDDERRDSESTLFSQDSSESDDVIVRTASAPIGTFSNCVRLASHRRRISV